MRCCCDNSLHQIKPPARLHAGDRFSSIVQWVIPVATFAIIPKCPACVAAYVMLFTGIGLSFPAATALRWTLIALNMSAFAFLLIRVKWRRPRSV